MSTDYTAVIFLGFLATPTMLGQIQPIMVQNCQHKTPEGAIFCPVCGAKVGERQKLRWDPIDEIKSEARPFLADTEEDLGLQFFRKFVDGEVFKFASLEQVYQVMKMRDSIAVYFGRQIDRIGIHGEHLSSFNTAKMAESADLIRGQMASIGLKVEVELHVRSYSW